MVAATLEPNDLIEAIQMEELISISFSEPVVFSA
jgi:hypothetical protein